MILQRWLGIRLDFLGALLTLIVALLAVGTRFTISPAQTGLVLSYILSVQQAYVSLTTKLSRSLTLRQIWMACPSNSRSREQYELGRADGLLRQRYRAGSTALGPGQQAPAIMARPGTRRAPRHRLELQAWPSSSAQRYLDVYQSR